MPGIDDHLGIRGIPVSGVRFPRPEEDSQRAARPPAELRHEQIEPTVAVPVEGNRSEHAAQPPADRYWRLRRGIGPGRRRARARNEKHPACRMVLGEKRPQIPDKQSLGGPLGRGGSAGVGKAGDDLPLGPCGCQLPAADLPGAHVGRQQPKRRPPGLRSRDCDHLGDGRIDGVSPSKNLDRLEVDARWGFDPIGRSGHLDPLRGRCLEVADRLPLRWPGEIGPQGGEVEVVALADFLRPPLARKALRPWHAMAVAAESLHPGPGVLGERRGGCRILLRDVP